MRIIALLAVTALPLAGQFAFEAAAIHPAPPQETGRTSIHRSTDKGRLSFSNVSLMDMIGDAYRLPHRQISGPDWLDSIRFDVTAKIPEGATEKQVPEMLRALLIERFALKQHDETKELPIYALIPGKSGPTLKKSDADGNNLSTNSNNLKSHLTASTSMQTFAEYLSTRLDRPVVDQTGLEGTYGFELEWAQENAPDPEGPSIFTAIQEQLGLKLLPTKGPVRLLVVDHIDKAPAEN